MRKIVFVCHGNICRSPMAEFIMKDLFRKAGLEQDISVSSRAARRDEIGNDMYPPVQKLLKEKGIPFSKREASLFTADDYSDNDYIFVMDRENFDDLMRYTKNDPLKKISFFSELYGEKRNIADPWYTRDFEKTYNDLLPGCEILLSELKGSL